jgi:hypothetical protein
MLICKASGYGEYKTGLLIPAGKLPEVILIFILKLVYKVLGFPVLTSKRKAWDNP